MSTPVSGRRVARRTRRGPDRLAAVALALVVAAGGLLAAAESVEPATERPPRAGAVPVDQVTAVCARVRGPGRADAVTLSAPVEGGGADGTVVAGPVAGPADPVPDAGRGALAGLDQPDPADGEGAAALTVSASGGLAVGRATFSVDRVPGAAAVQECLAPRAGWWFTGAAAGLDHTSTLVLANPDPGPAVVDVAVQGPEGPVEAVGTRGITVGPGEVRSIELVEIAPQAEELAVHVEASRGRVTAAVADRFATRPAAEPGRAWLPAQQRPSRVLRLGPLPRRADRRTLVVANPTDREALAEVEVAGGSGPFVPTDVSQLRVPPGSVVTADLGDVVGREAASVVLRSTVRLTGTVRTSRGGDVAYAPAAPLLGGPAAAPLPDGFGPTLHLTGAGEAAAARAVAYSASGEEVAATRLEVAAGTTVSWTPDRGAYLVVTPETGRVSGSVVLAGGAGLAQVPLRPLPTTLRRPVVTPVVR